MTGCGIWLDAALSRNTSGCPFTSSLRIGKSARIASTSNASGRSSTDVCIAVIADSVSNRCAGLLHYRLLQTPYDRPHRYALDYGSAEGVGQKVARHAVRQTAAFQVEELLEIDLADRRPVGALDVVRENLELGFRVHRRTVGKQKVAALLGRVGELGTWPHIDLPVEHRVRSVAHDRLVQLHAA